MAEARGQKKNKSRLQPERSSATWLRVIAFDFARAGLRPSPRRSEREWMGVEPTVATSAVPTTDFEDRGAHRDTSTPKRTEA